MWSKKKHEEGYAAIIDVHSGSVGIAIVFTENAEKDPEIIFAHREHITITENPDTPGLIRALQRALFSVALQFSGEGQNALKAHDPYGKITKTLFVCGAPWAQTATRFIQIEDKEPFIISEDKVRALILEAERRDEEELKTTTLLKELNISLIERAVIHTTVNGYPLNNPYGKKGKEMTLAHISGLIPEPILQSIHDMQDKILMHTTRTSHTFALVLFCVLRDIYPEHKHALFIDISAEATEICVMQDEILLETYVFPYGTHTFIRDLATHLKTFPDEALTHLREYGENTPPNIRTSIEYVQEIYTKYLTEAYHTLGERYIIPRHFFLITSRKLDVFFDILVKKISEKYTEPHGSFISLNNAVLPKTENATQTADVFFSLEARFFHKRHGCGEIT